MDGLTDSRIDIQIDGQIDKQIDSHVSLPMTYRQIDRQTGRAFAGRGRGFACHNVVQHLEKFDMITFIWSRC